jgi:hypothetical protein
MAHNNNNKNNNNNKLLTKNAVPGTSHIIKGAKI